MTVSGNWGKLENRGIERKGESSHGHGHQCGNTAGSLVFKKTTW